MPFRLIEGNPDITRSQSTAELDVIIGNDSLERECFGRFEVEYSFFPPSTDRRRLGDHRFYISPCIERAQACLQETFDGLEPCPLDGLAPLLKTMQVLDFQSSNPMNTQAERMKDMILHAKAHLCTISLQGGKTINGLYQTYEAPCLRLSELMESLMWGCMYEFVLRIAPEDTLPYGVRELCETMNQGNRSKISIRENLAPYKSAFTPPSTPI